MTPTPTPVPGHRLAEAVAHRLGPYTAMWMTLLIGGLAVVLLTSAAAEVYEDVVESDGAADIDVPVLQWMAAGRTPALNAAVTAFTNLGSSIGMASLTLLALAALSVASRSWRPAILLGATGAGSVLMTIVGKNVIGRLRPETLLAVPPYETSPSFPSGHTLNAAAIMAVVAYLVCLQVHRTWVRVLVVMGCGLFTLAMGLSRVYLGHHWTTDVAAAWALGLAWAGLVILAHRVFHTVRQMRVQEGLAKPGEAAH